MLILRKCKICGKKFKGVTSRNVYCSRKCFKKGYKLDKEECEFPTFKCPECRKITKLDFYPRDNYHEWKKFKCPKCGYEPISDGVTSD